MGDQGNQGDQGGQDRSPPATMETRSRSSRDPVVLRAKLESWLAAQLPVAAEPTISSLAGTDANGMSSETVLLDAEWSTDGRRCVHPMVVRLAPSPEDVPVFPSYDLGDQYEVIRLVGECSDVPVPRVGWYEADASVIGSEFFTMDRIDGRIPPDVLPYNFGDSWLFDATAEEQRELQDRTVEVLAGVHGIDHPMRRFTFLVDPSADANSLVRRFGRTRVWYEWVVDGSTRSAVIDRAISVLEPRLPSADADRTVLCWGDARIGNVIFRGVEPVGVLDWEMMALGPPELDVAWLIYGHRVFEAIAHAYGLPGMPAFLVPEDVTVRYEVLTGHRVRHLTWYLAFSALQFAIVFLRVGQRSIHFGEAPAPDHVDDLIRNRDDLEQLLDEVAALG